MKIGIDEIPGLRHAARIGGRRAVVELVASTMRQWKPCLARADAGELGREIGKLARNNMHHLALPLDTALDADHAGAEHNAPELLKHLFPDDDVATPVSSSMVMNITPFAEPGRWRTSTRPEISIGVCLCLISYAACPVKMGCAPKDDFVNEVTAFPNARNDDQVDSMTQALIWMKDDSQTGGFSVWTFSGRQIR